MRKLSKFSLIIPCYNEEDVIVSTHQRIKPILESLVKNQQCTSYEILYINDGSTDGTQKILEDVFSKDNNTRVITFTNNAGLQNALSAGLLYAKGDAAVTIDADLQDPPEKIADMITAYEQGYNLVLGVRDDRQTDRFFKRFTAESFYRLFRFLGGKAVYNHADFRLMSRPLIDQFNQLPERPRFIRSKVLTLDPHYAQVFYKRQLRQQGTTKFTFIKMFLFSLDGLFSLTGLSQKQHGPAFIVHQELTH